MSKQIFELTKDHERFDFSKLADKQAHEYLKDGTAVMFEQRTHLGDSTEWNVIKIVPKNSHVSLVKIFYLKGSLKEKGCYWVDGLGVSGRFKMGVWYTFDEAGKPTGTEDFDKPFRFTLDDVLNYLKENKIPPPAYQNQENDAHTTSYGHGGTEIHRNPKDKLPNGKSGPTWNITTTTPTRFGPCLHGTVLDGVTGKVLENYEIGAE